MRVEAQHEARESDGILSDTKNARIAGGQCSLRIGDGVCSAHPLELRRPLSEMSVEFSPSRMQRMGRLRCG